MTAKRRVHRLLLAVGLLTWPACGGGVSGTHPGAGGSGGDETGGEAGTGGGGGGSGGAGGHLTVDAGGGSGGATEPADATVSGDDAAAMADASEVDSGGASGTGGTGGTGGVIMPAGLGPWTGKDDVMASDKPPGGLSVQQVPQFVAVGFDDNPEAAGMNALTGLFRGLKNQAGAGQAATYDGAPVRVTFYMTSTYGSNGATLQSWSTALNDGHEIGDHTITHGDGFKYDATKWKSEISGCLDFLKGTLHVPAKDLVGFRAPYLHYTADTFATLKALGFWYDCSIEDGYQNEMDGTNYFWPYTLDNGSPGFQIIVMDPDQGYKPIGKYPGLWEMPDHPVIVPPDAECANYGIPSGLRAKLKSKVSYFNVGDGKVTGLDYNVFDEFKMNDAEYLATLKYTLDLRLRGNRAPFMFGGHSVYYSNGSHLQAMRDFVKYALSKPEVRFVPLRRILEWVRNPAPLR
jgi:hypothetical protein